MDIRSIRSAVMFILIIVSTTGQRIFIHQQDVELTIPVIKETFYALDVSPIIQLKFTDLRGDATAHHYMFTLKRSHDFLRINEVTGEIYFQRDKWLDQKLVKNLKASVKNIETGSIARTTLTFNFIKAELKQFCVERSCFYDSIHYLTTEFNMRKSNENQVIGDINPPLYRRLCDSYETFYYFDNGTDIAELSRKDQLMKRPRLDYETMMNHNVTIDMMCELKDERLQDVVTRRKLLNITVVDRNDNLITVDDDSKNVELYRLDREFKEDDIVNRSAVIIFRDLDSIEANNRIEIKTNDTSQLFSSRCSPTTWHYPEDNLTTTAIICDIFFTRDGHLSQPRYCFQLQAFDMEIKKKHHATSKVCVITIDHPSQDVTTLIRDTATSSTEPQEAPTTKFDQKLYPDEVQLSQSASRFARVAQPLTDTTEVEFTLTANPFGAFDITPTGGIIFIMRPNVLAQALPASTIKIEVTWKQHRQQINVFLKPETTQCSNSTANPTEDFCARHDNQESCQSSCGIGAGNGRCKWRQHEGFELISKVFSTCVPDLNFCSNQECDPLESLASSLNYLVCPQDCSRQVFGNLNTNAVGISGSSKSNVCTCDEFEDCVCGPSNVIEDSTDTTIVVPVIPVIVSDGNKCGDHCLAALIGVLSCSTVIILLLVVFTTCRSRELRTSIESLDSFDSHFNKTSARLAKFEVVHETHSHPDFYSRRWEIDITRVKVERVIGEGEFGKVMLASLKGFHENESTPVVIKTVKNIENDSEMTSLKKEFEQLQKVSIRPHPNVITLLGCYSKGSDPWIFLEYCVFESLKDYLLASRLIPSLIGTDGVDKVTVDDILKFSLQTTNGMAHLAELKLVHRDLAARNVLLFEGKICKVSDFGLTRNVCNKCDTYSKCSDDKVPVKWLAPESLSSSEEYTTKSDVWAFGILGYELIMLGSSPYPTVAANQTEILNFLLNGSRMQRPSNCSNELFRVFESCWAFDPRNRPTFEYLSRKFQELIVLNSYTDQYSLWTTPEFSAAEIQSYDEAYYRNYIQRIDRTRAYFKVQATKKKCVRRNRSSSGEFLKSKSESSTLTPVSNKSLTVSKSLTHINNAGYDGSFDSMKSLLMRHKRENVSNQTKSDLTAVSTSTCSSYLPMSRTQTKVNRSSSFKVTCQVVPSSSSPNITAAGYIPVGDMLGKTNTFKRFSSPMMVETRTQTEN